VGADGTLVADVYQDPVNYKDSGAWQPIDNTLVAGVVGYENRWNRLQVDLPADLGSGPVRVSDGSHWVSFVLDGASGFASLPSGSSETYSGVLPGVNVTYTATGETLKEDTVLLGPSSQRSFSYSVSTSSGISAVREPDGSINFVNADGRALFSFSPPRLTDAAGADGLASYQLTSTDTGYEVTLDANSDWLSSSDRVWPVTIDPSLTDDSAFYQSKTPAPTQDGYVASAANAGSNWFGLGYEKVGWNSSGVRRTVQQYSPVLPRGAQILNAKLFEYLQSETSSTPSASVGVYGMTRSWTTGATWNTYNGTNAWSTSGGGGDSASEPLQSGSPWAKTTLGSNGAGQFYTWDITQLVAGWANTDVPNLGLMLKYVNETTNSNLFTLASGTASGQKPYISLTYNLGIGDPGADSGNPPVPGQTTTKAGPYSFDSFAVDDQTTIKVNYGNGNLLLCQNDLHLPGVSGFDLNLKQCWNSLGGDPNGKMSGFWLLSPGQTTYLDKVGTSVVYHNDTGDTQPFTPNGGGQYIAPIGFHAILTATSGTLSACASPSNAYAYLMTFTADGSKAYFNSDGQLIAKADRSGNAICFTYGPTDTIKDTAGRTITLWYTQGRLTSFTAPGICAAPNCTFEYYPDNRLKSFTDAAGDKTQYAYNTGNGNLTTLTDPNGHSTALEYTTANGGPAALKVTQPANPNNPTVFTYGDMSQAFCGYKNATDVKTPRSTAAYTSYCADAGLRVRAIQAPDGSVSQTDYTDTANGGSSCVDQYGDSLDNQPCATQSFNGYWTTYGYDPTRLTQLWEQNPVQTSSNRQTWFYLDSSHPYYPTTSADADGHITRYTYTAAGNISTEQDALGNTTKYCYVTACNADGNGEPVTEQTGLAPVPRTATTLAAATVVGATNIKVTSVTNMVAGEGIWIDTGANQEADTILSVGTAGSGGTGLTLTTPLTLTRTSAAAAQDIGTALTCPSGTPTPICPTTSYSYDSQGNEAQMTVGLNDLNRVSTYGYDAAGNQTNTTDGQTLDASHNVVCLSTNTCPLTSETFDGMGRVLTATDPIGQTTTKYTYDGNGNRTSQTDGLSYDSTSQTYYCPSGSTCLMTGETFGANNELLSETAPDGTLTASYSYDADGNELTEAGGTGANPATYSYNSSNQQTSMQGPSGCATGTSCPTQYTYDADGNMLTELTPDGLETIYQYDHADRLIQISYDFSYDASQQRYVCAGGDTCAITTYGYDPAGNLFSVTDGSAAGNNASQTITHFDSDNREQTVTTGLDGSGSCPTGTCPQTIYAYDNNGNEASIRGPELTQTQYHYDAANEVTTFTGGLTASGAPPTYSCPTGSTCPTTTANYDNSGNLASTQGSSTTQVTAGVTSLPGGGELSTYLLPDSSEMSVPTPPANFDPLSATPAQLEEYALPPRPTDPADLAEWTSLVSESTPEQAPPASMTVTMATPTVASPATASATMATPASMTGARLDGNRSAGYAVGQPGYYGAHNKYDGVKAHITLPTQQGQALCTNNPQQDIGMSIWVGLSGWGQDLVQAGVECGEQWSPNQSPADGKFHPFYTYVPSHQNPFRYSPCGFTGWDYPNGYIENGHKVTVELWWDKKAPSPSGGVRPAPVGIWREFDANDNALGKAVHCVLPLPKETKKHGPWVFHGVGAEYMVEPGFDYTAQSQNVLHFNSTTFDRVQAILWGHEGRLIPFGGGDAGVVHEADAGDTIAGKPYCAGPKNKTSNSFTVEFIHYNCVYK